MALVIMNLGCLALVLSRDNKHFWFQLVTYHENGQGSWHTAKKRCQPTKCLTGGLYLPLYRSTCSLDF